MPTESLSSFPTPDEDPSPPPCDWSIFTNLSPFHHLDTPPSSPLHLPAMSYSSSPLTESFPPTRFSSPVPSPTRTEHDFPIEVDQSFNSSMSISESPCFSPTPNLFKPLPASPKGSLLSPTPAFGLRPKRPDPVPIQIKRPEGLLPKPLGGARTFGRELSLNATTARTSGPSTLKAARGKMLPPAVPEHSSKVPKRGGIPMQWTSSNEETGAGGTKLFQAALLRRETEPLSSFSPKSTFSDGGMDIDSPAMPRKTSITASPAFSGGSSFSGSPGLGSFFCDSPGAPAMPGKRRSLISGSPASPSGSPSAKRTSLGVNRPEKVTSSSAMLFGVGRPNTIASRRAQPYKRPPLLMVSDENHRTGVSSAYPILYAPKPTAPGPASATSTGTFPRAATAPMRRAFSVCDQPCLPEQSEDESEYEASPSTSAAHAEYARRTGQVFAPRVDGSPGFKPVRASIAGDVVQGITSPCGKGKKASPFGNSGLPGFGDNEKDGKILPCHKVKEDGLVRITPGTLDDLLKGKYSEKIKRYHILDCRFDYEYAGGHIDGAINVKSMDALDELLLSEASGVHADGDSLPSPSRSGELPAGEQVVLVFHCEFSAKRAPTFAKHLRSRDRTLNSGVYPKIFYPEVYILEGGYCGFYQSYSDSCDPKGYTPMDDPKHFERRNSDLHDFRKFSRTRSFTYGETQPVAPSRSQPSCPPLAFAAASAAQGRRQGPTIDEEEHEQDSSPMGASSGGEVEASPCQRVSLTQAPIFGSAKTRTLGRTAFARVQSYAGTTAR